MRQKLLVLGLLLLSVIARAEPAASVDDLLDAFSRGCNMGPWTKAALDRSAAITNLYERLRQKSSCQGANLERAVIASSSIQSELRALEEDESLKNERELDEASNDLLLELQQPGINPDLQANLISYYSSTRYELSLARAQNHYRRNPDYKTNLTNGMAAVSRHMQSLISASRELSDCYKNNPSVATEIGASITELSGTFAPPLVGLGITAVANMVKLGVEAARTIPVSKAIYKTYNVRMRVALSCGLEALSRDYCKARDARTLMGIATKQQANQETLPFFKGVELQDRYLPVLYRWLDKVVNGSEDMRDGDQASKINLQNARISNAKAVKNSANGFVNEAQREIDRAVRVEAKRDIIRGFLQKIVDLYFPCSESNNPERTANCDPSAMYYQLDNATAYLKKIINKGPPDATYPSYNKYLEAIMPLLTVEDFPVIVKNIGALYEERFSEIVRVYNDKVNVDLPSLVRDYTRVDSQGLSAQVAMEKLFEFLDSFRFQASEPNPPTPKDLMDKKMIDQLRAKLVPVHVALTDANAVDDTPGEKDCDAGIGIDSQKNRRATPKAKCPDLSPAAKVLALAYETFRLEKNNVYLPRVSGDLVAIDLNNRYNRGEGPKEMDDLYALSSIDLNLLLARSQLTPFQVMGDIMQGLDVTAKSLKEFREFYGPTIGNLLKDIQKDAVTDREPKEVGDLRAPNRYMLARLCALTLVTGVEWPNKADKKLCADTQLSSLTDASLTLDFNSLDSGLSNKSFDDRVCAYEDFLRADRLANLSLRKPKLRGTRNEARAVSTLRNAFEMPWQALSAY